MKKHTAHTPKKAAARHHPAKDGGKATGVGMKPARGTSRPQMGGKRAAVTDGHGGDMHTLGRETKGWLK